MIGLDQDRLESGTLFALPAGVDLDIVNDPDPRHGIYQSLILEITPEMIPDLPRHRHKARSGAAIPLRPALIEAVTHAATAIADGPAAAPIRRARIGELLALLLAEPAAAVLFDLSAGQRVAQMIRGRPDYPWDAATMSRMLGMSESTLRRRLRADGGFGAILRRERMLAAQRMLEQGLPSGTVAGAVGYSSRAHFARAYRDQIGRNPAEIPGAG